MPDENNQTQTTENPVTSAPQSEKKNSLGLSQNTELVLTYLFSWLGGLVFLIAEKENKFVKFHAAQSLISGIAAVIVLWIVTAIIGAIGWAVSAQSATVFVVTYTTHNPAIYGVFTLINGLLWLAYLACEIFLILKAIKGEKFKLPIIGDYAEKIAK